ncbi:hypothetical protein KRZ98_18415 [Sphingobium sp. AS12]|uniref:hypothetical protein n=1 Tax=Sphingobium sp. AS12 TaxID=2849495 RepID=UPI001C31D16A|nr:hypothetical protein [Sphingobium sp. AS12]MBV2150212.1 hypothetical protein [Sphingobium sp. AS12]
MPFRFPRTTDYDALQSCYTAFQETHSDVFAEWLRIEGKGRDIEINELEAVSAQVRAFVQDRLHIEDHLAVIRFWMDMRWFLISQHWPERLTDGSSSH